MNKTYEIEARFINVNREKIESKLNALGAVKVKEVSFREWIFHFRNEEWDKDRRRVRVRTDGAHHWLTYKANPTWELDSTEEIDLAVSSAEDAMRFMKSVGIPLQRYQEKRRISYKRGNTVFEMDFWPKIPMVLEIEAPTKEEVMEGAKLLGLDWKDAIFIDQKMLHLKYYGIDLDKETDYRFVNNE